MGGMLEYHNFSWHGDPRWYAASRFTGYAPIVVLWIFTLSVIQTVIGAIWIVQVGGDMTIPKILQTLILPGLAFFNSVPSLHLHMLVRKNPPGLALFFSSSLALLWLVSAILFLVSCSSDSASISLALRQTECPKGHVGVRSGPSPAIWNVVVAFSLVSAVLYSMHAGMAAYVKVVVTREEREKKRSGAVDLVVVDPAELELARERWTELGRHEL